MNSKLVDLHIDWINESKLPLYLYTNFIEDFSETNSTPFLEKSLKLDITTGNIFNQKRYSINTKNFTQNTINQSINRFVKYTNLDNEYVRENISRWLNFDWDFDWYIGLDNDIHKIGVDYHNKYITGIACSDLKLFNRTYYIYDAPCWEPSLTEYIALYERVFNKQIKRAVDYTITNTLNSEDSNIYIKEDTNGIVWHFNCKQFSYPHFDCLLNPKFNEKFTWFSFDSNLKYLTLYIRPTFFDC